MLVGCCEISIHVIVKHVKHIGMIRALCLSEGIFSFSMPGGDRKIAGLWFAWEKSVLRLTLWQFDIHGGVLL